MNKYKCSNPKKVGSVWKVKERRFPHNIILVKITDNKQGVIWGTWKQSDSIGSFGRASYEFSNKIWVFIERVV